jgi:hypothetical protein
LDCLRQLPDRLPLEEALGIPIPEAPDHEAILTRCVNSVKRLGTNIVYDRSLRSEGVIDVALMTEGRFACRGS